MIKLKPAEIQDFDDYYDIRCGASDLYWMGYEKEPDRTMIQQIFLERLGIRRFSLPGDKRIYMITDDGANVGFIQFSLSEEGLEFGISVKDEQRGKGYGSEGMKQAAALAREFSDRCFAHIRDDNVASQKALMGAGLKPTNEVEMKSFPKVGMIRYRKYIL